MFFQCPRCFNTSRFVRDVIDLETVDGNGACISRKKRVEEGPLKCMSCGYPAIVVTEPADNEITATSEA